jgi:hypothetical protein
MKIETATNKETKQPTKHQVGEVYYFSGDYYLVVENFHKYTFINLSNSFVVSAGTYDSLAEMDADPNNSSDVHVNAKVVIS